MMNAEERQEAAMRDEEDGGPGRDSGSRRLPLGSSPSAPLLFLLALLASLSGPASGLVLSPSSRPQPPWSSGRGESSSLPSRRHRAPFRRREAVLPLFASPSSSSSSSSSSSPEATAAAVGGKASDGFAGADFEYQEMKILLGDMRRAGIGPRGLGAPSRGELAGYAGRVAAGRRRRGGEGAAGASAPAAQGELPGTEWRLAFSTAYDEDLPRDATVVLRFVDSSRLDYVLEFGRRTPVLDAITARCRWWCSSDADGGGDGAGEGGGVSYEYEELTVDAGPFKGAGLLGLFRGRAGRIGTAYFDGEYWIERARSPSQGSTRGEDEAFNVYVRQQP
jgi:hypothetical protein